MAGLLLTAGGCAILCPILVFPGGRLASRVLLISAGLVHPPLVGRWRLQRGLERAPRVIIHTAGSLESAAPLLSSFDAVVLHYHRPNRSLSESVVAGLERFVAGGGGVLAIHAATASYNETPRYFEVLGGRFAGHGPVGVYTARATGLAGRYFGGITAFTVRDELYTHELQVGVEVQFTASSGSEEVPVVWLKAHGRGRICYAGPGHTPGTMANQTYLEVLRRGLHYVLGRG